MPLPIIPKPEFPNLPFLPGIPALFRSPTFSPAVRGVLSTLEGIVWQMYNNAPVWGVFDQSGQQVLAPDNVFDIAWRNESAIARFPLQDGDFANYDKVQNPFETSLRLTKGGSIAERQQFLATIDAIANDTNLYNIVTPEKTYINCNIQGVRYERDATNGANLLKVDISFLEIRSIAGSFSIASLITSPKLPSATPPINNGKVQPVVPSQSILKAILGKVLLPDSMKVAAASMIGKAVSVTDAPLLQIPTSSNPNQLGSITLQQQNVQMGMTTTPDGMFATFTNGNAPVVTNRIVRDGSVMIDEPSTNFTGNIAMVNSLANKDPDYKAVGNTSQLIYAVG